jgi:hypothetical protein
LDAGFPCKKKICETIPERSLLKLIFDLFLAARIVDFCKDYASIDHDQPTLQQHAAALGRPGKSGV